MFSNSKVAEEEALSPSHATPQGPKDKVAKKRFKCDICEKELCSKVYLKVHALTVHAGEKLFECETCGKRMNHRGTFLAHKRTHEEKAMNTTISPKKELDIDANNESAPAKAEASFDCHICPKRFPKSKILKYHVTRMHVSKSAFPCGICEKQFANQTILRHHMSSDHAREEEDPQTSFIVADDDEEYMDVTNISNLHEEPAGKEGEEAKIKGKKVKCDDCGKEFSSNFAMGIHIRKKHKGKKPFKCNVCGKQFAYKKKFTAHGCVRHIKERPPATKASVKPRDKGLQCQICSKKFLNSQNLKCHLTVMHFGKKTPSCSICDKQFATKLILRHHIKSAHEGEKDPQPQQQSTDSDKENQDPTVIKIIRKVSNSIAKGSKKDKVVSHNTDHDAAKKHPFLLHVHRGVQTRLPLEVNELDRVRAFVDDEWWRQYSLDPAGIPCLKIDQSYTAPDGRGVLTCLDLPTREWVCTALRGASIGGVRYRGWRVGERDDMVRVSTVVSGHMASRSPEEFMRFVVANQAEAISRKCKYEVVEEGDAEGVCEDGGRVYRYRVDKKFVEALRKLEWNVFVGTGKFTFRVD